MYSIYKICHRFHIQCSQKCNAGYKSRIVKCISSETGIVAPDYYCDSSQQPMVKIACNRHPCPTWNTGDWSEVLKQFHSIIPNVIQANKNYIY